MLCWPVETSWPRTTRSAIFMPPAFVDAISPACEALCGQSSGPSFSGACWRPSGCPFQSPSMLCPWVFPAWVSGGQLLWPWAGSATWLPMKPHPTGGTQKAQGLEVTTTPWTTAPPCHAVLKEGGAGPVHIPRGRHLPHKPVTYTFLQMLHIHCACYMPFHAQLLHICSNDT